MKNKKSLVKDFIELIEKTGVLKKIPRMGWKMRGVPECESVADHSFRVIFVAMTLGDILSAKHKINMERLMRIAILHEIPEAEITDLALGPALSVGRDIKHKAESAAFTQIFEKFEFSKFYFDCWLEFENTNTIEGKIVKLADKIDMMVQAAEYEKVGARNLDDFWKNIENFEDYEFSFIRDLYKELNSAHTKLTKKKCNSSPQSRKARKD